MVDSQATTTTTTTTTTYVCGGRLGDLIHSLWIIKQDWKKTGRKGVLLLSEAFGADTFTAGLKHTFEEVKPLIIQQSYIDDVVIFDASVHPTLNGMVNLNIWRYAKNITKTDWITLFSEVFSHFLDRTAWVELKTPNLYSDKYADVIVVHRSLHRHNLSFPWKTILSNNKCLFVTSNAQEYDKFKFKDMVPLLLAKDFLEMAHIISSSRGFCGNQSAPLAIAVALGKICYCELSKEDAFGYTKIAEHVFYTNNIPRMLNMSEKIL